MLLPVLVCLDGFTITHSAEPVALLADDEVRAFVGEYRDPEPAARPERVRRRRGRSRCRTTTSSCAASRRPRSTPPLDVLDEVAAEFERADRPALRRASRPYRLEDADARDRRLGSTAGTVKDVVDELRDEGEPVGLLKIALVPALPARGDPRRARRTSRRSPCSTAPTRRAAPPPLHAEVAAALYGSGADARRATSTASAAATCTRPTCARSSPAPRRPLRRAESEPMSRLKTLVRNEHGVPPLRGGHSLCQGCGIPMVVRTVARLDRQPGRRRQRDRLPRGRDDALPDHRVERALAPRRLRERGRGRRAASRAPTARCAGAARCPQDDEVTFVVFAGDGGTYDIGLQALSGALERGHRFALRLLRQRGVHEHGHPALRRDAVRREHDHEPGRARASSGKAQQRKDMTAIAVAHHIPYVAQAAVDRTGRT